MAIDNHQDSTHGRKANRNKSLLVVPRISEDQGRRGLQDRDGLFEWNPMFSEYWIRLFPDPIRICLAMPRHGPLFKNKTMAIQCQICGDLGTVGIGTTGPLGLLTAGTGGAGITLNSSDVATGAWIRNDGSNTVFSTNVGSMYFGLSGSSKTLSFYPGGTTASMTITTSGNVGIGTTSPAEVLDVNGGIRPGASTVVTETCGSGAANHEGTQRYNYTTHNMEYCNGTAWTSMSGGSGFTSCTIVTNSSNDGNMTEFATCASGYTMTGGGCQETYSWPTQYYWMNTYPSSASASAGTWSCASDYTISTRPINAYAICCH